MDKFLEEVNAHAGVIFTLIVALLTAAVTWGATTTAASDAIADHVKRIEKLEQHDEDTGKAISRIDQHLTDMDRRLKDLWVDNGHKE